MKDLLAATQRGIIEPFAWSRTLLAFDFDGTLAPIVDIPDEAAMRPRTRALLKRAAALYPCVVISGRSLPDAKERLRGVELLGVVGNHGVEPWRATKKTHRRVREWHPLFERALRGEVGVEVEDKIYSLAVHYRRSRNKKKVRALVEELASTLDQVRVIGGIEVVNIVPADAPHKGMALERERARLKCDTAIYVGDDVTDEDVFALDQPGRLLSIRVGQKLASQAAYFIKSQAEIDTLIARLISLREKRGSAVAVAKRAGTR